MKKLLICLAVAGLVLLIAACGTTEPEYQPTPDIAYTPAEEPETPPTATTPPPLPTGTPPPTPPPPLPGILMGDDDGIIEEEESEIFFLPVPPEPLDLPINRRVVSAGHDRSAVIAADGSVWQWGGFYAPGRALFANWVIWGDHQLTVYKEDGTELIPNQIVHHDDIDAWLECSESRAYTESGIFMGYVRHSINDLTILDEHGNEFTDADFAQVWLNERSFLLIPQQWEQARENIASVSLHTTLQLPLHTIDEDGLLTIFGTWGWDDDDEWRLLDNLYFENVVDVITAVHTFHYGMIWTESVNFHHGILFADGSFGFVPHRGEFRSMFDGNIIAMEQATFHQLFLAYNGQLWARGSGNTVGVMHHQGTAPPALVMENVAAISASDGHSLALTKDGRVYAWGRNQSGQIGDGNRHTQQLPVFIMDNITAISAGGEHSMAIDADGILWGWGLNSNGQVGYGDAAQHTRPVQILENVVAVSAGESHTIAITTDGAVWTWGQNINGQLGDGTRYNRHEPVRVKTGAMVP